MNKKERTQDTARLLLNMFNVAVLAIFFIVVWYRYYRDTVYYFRRGNYLLTGIYAFLFILFTHVYGGFNIGYAKTSDLIFSQSIAVVFANLIIYFMGIMVNKQFFYLKGYWLFVLAQIGIVIVLNIIINQIYYRVFPAKKTVLVYDEEDQSIYERIMAYQSNSYAIDKLIQFNELKDASILNDYECVIGVGLHPEEKEVLVKKTYESGKSLYLVPDIYDVIVNGANSVYLVDTPVLRTHNSGPSQLAKIGKRIFDIIFSVILIALTCPICLIVMIAIWLNDRGPVFYTQTRLTQYGRPFEIIKFRSMKLDAEKDGVARMASEHDDRITKVGKVIRALRMDELPQLINILKGDMSVVGPRPERPEIVEEIFKEVPEFNYRLKVKAGLTGYAQVYGKYNTRLKDKLLFDLYYIENYSLLLDLRIIFMTFKILFMKESTEGVVEKEQEKVH